MTAPDPGRTIVADYDRTARAVKGADNEAVQTPGIDLRQGVVVAVNNAAGTVDVALGGDTAVIPGVKHTSNYRPTINDTVQVIVKGGDLYCIDRLSNDGPSVISGAASANVFTVQSRTSTSYGDLATVGPSMQVNISPSGRLLVQVSTRIECIVDGSDAAGGAMGVALTGANVASPADNEAVIGFLDLVCGVAIAGNSTICASMATLLTGLNPGLTTVTAKYRSAGSGGTTVTFWDRQLWAVPL